MPKMTVMVTATRLAALDSPLPYLAPDTVSRRHRHAVRDSPFSSSQCADAVIRQPPFGHAWLGGMNSSHINELTTRSLNRQIYATRFPQTLSRRARRGTNRLMSGTTISRDLAACARRWTRDGLADTSASTVSNGASRYSRPARGQRRSTISSMRRRNAATASAAGLFRSRSCPDNGDCGGD